MPEDILLEPGDPGVDPATGKDIPRPPIVAQYQVRINLRSDEPEAKPPKLDELEMDIVDGLEATFGWTRENITVNAERVDK